MKIFGIEITKIKKKDFLKEICLLNEKKIIFTPNPEILLESQKDKIFKKTLEKATYLLPDGIGLYIAAQILDNRKDLLHFFQSPHPNPLPKVEGTWVASSLPLGEIEWGLLGNMKDIINIMCNLFLLPYYFFNLFFRRSYLYNKYWDRICWSDLTRYLLEYFNENNINISIIDLYVWWENLSLWDIKKISSQKVFKKRLKKEFPKLKINYFIYSKEEKENIIKEINKSKSKILFSTLGMKVQEESVIEIMKKCDNIKLWLWVWSSFDYIIWFQKRAPLFFRKLGLEWLYRLLTWPRKINRLKRLWNAIFVFTWTIIINK